MQAVSENLEQICLPASVVSQELVCTYQNMGLEVRAWKVKDPETIKSAIQAGVNGRTVDFPHLLLEVVSTKARTEKE